MTSLPIARECDTCSRYTDVPASSACHNCRQNNHYAWKPSAEAVFEALTKRIDDLERQVRRGQVFFR